jgi:hypothetical protein
MLPRGAAPCPTRPPTPRPAPWGAIRLASTQRCDCQLRCQARPPTPPPPPPTPHPSSPHPRPYRPTRQLRRGAGAADDCAGPRLPRHRALRRRAHRVARRSPGGRAQGARRGDAGGRDRGRCGARRGKGRGKALWRAGAASDLLPARGAPRPRSRRPAPPHALPGPHAAPQNLPKPAGFDTRAQRFARPGVKFIEIDLPHASAAKRALVARALPDAAAFPRPAYVAADLAAVSLEDALAGTGFDRTARTVFLAEGVRPGWGVWGGGGAGRRSGGQGQGRGPQAEQAPPPGAPRLPPAARPPTQTLTSLRTAPRPPADLLPAARGGGPRPVWGERAPGAAARARCQGRLDGGSRRAGAPPQIPPPLLPRPLPRPCASCSPACPPSPAPAPASASTGCG